MKTLIVCKSTHHGNTWKIAQAMAEVLAAGVLSPEDVDVAAVGRFDLVGFGSGVYFGRTHTTVQQLVRTLGALGTVPKRAFLFSTSGLPFLSGFWHRGLRRELERFGSRIIGEFSCRGWDTVGPLALFGGFNRGHPNERDLERARGFARAIAGRTLAPPLREEGHVLVSSAETLEHR